MAITPITSWRKQVYIAKLTSVSKNTSGDQMPVYATPIAFTMNIQPLSDDARIEMFGASAKKMYRSVMIGITYDINEFDVAYLEDATPSGETKNGANSNFIVRRIQAGNIATNVYFESIKGK
jgi:hypothetical protein